MAQTNAEAIALFDGAILRRAAGDSFSKLNPAGLIRNPVIFVTEVVAMLTTVLGVRELVTGQSVLVRVRHCRVAMADRVVRDLRRGGRRRPRARPGRHAAPRAQRHDGQAADSARTGRARPTCRRPI